MRWRTGTGPMLLQHLRAMQPQSTCRVKFSLKAANKLDCFVVVSAKTAFCLHSAPKNEDTYEIAIPYEESNFEQQGFFNQSDPNFDGKCLSQYF